MNFEISLIFLIKLFFLHNQKVMIQTYILRTKRAFKIRSKAIFITFKGLSIKQKTYMFLEDESLT